MKSSSSSSGGGASFFFGYSFFLGAYLGTYLAAGAELAAGADDDPIFLDPSAISCSIFFPLTDSKSLLMSASSVEAETVPKTFLISAASKI